MTVAVRPAGARDHTWILATARELLGDERQVHTRRQFGVLDGVVLLATLDGRRAGFATWDHAGTTAELLAIAVRAARRGAGRALLDHVLTRARRVGCERLVVVTTDDNVGAQCFYAASGFTLAERRVGAVDECRRRYKPSIPAGIHDELEYVIDLDDHLPEEER